MGSKRPGWATLLLALGIGCQESSAPGLNGLSGGPSTTTGHEPGTTSSIQSASGEAESDEGTTHPGTSSTTGTETAVDSGSDTSVTCPFGTLGCPCNVDWCEEGLYCTGGTCQDGVICASDPHEENGSEATATYLGELSDASMATVGAVLAGAEDADWFVYEGDDDFPSFVSPFREVDAFAGLRFCKFAECLAGLAETELECPTGVAPTTSPEGRPGCCSNGGFELDNLDCPGSEDNARIYLRVDQAASACVDYTITYAY